MCGIVGAIGIQDPNLVQRMGQVLNHRGPDGIGFWADREVKIGVTRLAIMDPCASAVPVTDESGSIAIAFNGEIYNYRELRQELSDKGHVFATDTDTEVVVHAYEELRHECVLALQGMFAFAIVDKDQVVLARDRLGIKPLCYSLVAGGSLFLFASEPKALLQCDRLQPRLSMQALADSMILGHPVGSQTHLDGIDLLPPGHTLIVRRGPTGRPRVDVPRRYFHLEAHPDESVSIKEAQRLVEESLRGAVTSHLRADVEVGLTLSGGLDSTLLALLAAQQQSKPLLAFTVADRNDHPDLAEAARVADRIGATHVPLVMGFRDFLAAIPGHIETMGRPSSLMGIPFQWMCGRIADRVKVCMHGEGADEVFGGYREYLDRRWRVARMLNRLPLLEKLHALPSDGVQRTIERLHSPETFKEYLDAVFEVNLADQLERLHLDVVDKSSMAYGVEMRVPYLDDDVIAAVGRVPRQYLVRSDIGVCKYILRRLCLERFGFEVLDVILREKLSAPSAGLRLVARFDRLCDRVLPEDYLVTHEMGGWFRTKRQLLMFELFAEIYLERRGDTADIGTILDFMARRAGYFEQGLLGRGAGIDNEPG